MSEEEGRPGEGGLGRRDAAAEQGAGEKEEIKQAQEVVKLREAGLSIKKISERTELSESTVARRLDLWDRHIGKEPADEEDINRITSLIFDFFGSDDAAERIGEISGTNAAAVKGILDRMSRREVTKAEVSRLLANIRGAVVGYFGGTDVFKRFEQLFLPRRHPYSESEIDRALKKRVEVKPKKKKKVEQAA